MKHLSQIAHRCLDEYRSFVMDLRAETAWRRRSLDQEIIFFDRVMEGVKWVAALALIINLFRSMFPALFS